MLEVWAYNRLEYAAECKLSTGSLVGVEQLVAHQLHALKVTGSSPVPETMGHCHISRVMTVKSSKADLIST